MTKKNTYRLFNKGGNSSLTPASYPKGVSWSVDTLPGQGGNTSDIGNYFGFNTNEGIFPDTVDTNNQVSFITGGKRSKIKLRNKKRKTYKKNLKRRRTIKGGSSRNMLFQSPVNFGRNVLYGANSFVNQLSGKPDGLSPSPTDQLSVENSFRMPKLIDPISIHNNVDKLVANI